MVVFQVLKNLISIQKIRINQPITARENLIQFLPNNRKIRITLLNENRSDEFTVAVLQLVLKLKSIEME